MAAPRYDNLQALRGIGAVLILIHHSGATGYVAASLGDYGVSFFFMLSGFVLANAYAGRDIRFGKFLSGRLVKLYPVYLLTLVLAVALQPSRTFSYPLAPVLDLLMLQSWVPNADIYFSGNAVAWFISSLLFCYVMFVPAMKLRQLYPRGFHYLSVLALTGYFILVSFIPEARATSLIYVFPPMQAPAFLLGILAYEAHDRIKETVARNAAPLQMLCILVIAVQIYFYDRIAENYALASYWWAIDFITIVVFAVQGERRDFMSRLLDSNVLQCLGEVSFIFYLFHTLVIYVYNGLCGSAGYISPVWLTIIFCTVITYVISRLVLRYFDRPVARLLK